MARWLCLALALLLSACGDDGPPTIPTRDEGPLPDRGPPPDLGPDAGPLDAGPDAGPFDAGPDAGPFDAGPRDIGPSSITIDGVVGLGEWGGPDVRVFENGTGDAAPFAGNALERVSAVRRSGFLILALEGMLTNANGYVVYVDGSYDSGDGVASFVELADRSANLEQLISKQAISVGDDAYRLDFAWAAFRGATSISETGWLDVASNTVNYVSVADSTAPTACVGDACETRIPLSTLGTAAGAEIAFFVRLVDETTGIANQTLPEDDALSPEVVGALALLPEP